jgi:hypothetical protein
MIQHACPLPIRTIQLANRVRRLQYATPANAHVIAPPNSSERDVMQVTWAA